MKSILKKSLVVAVAVLLGAGMNFATAAEEATVAGYKVAVVDVASVISKSAQVKALKEEQQKKTAEIQKWLETVKADVDKQSTKENKEKLLQKYNTEFAKKQEAIRKDYAAKLQAIDKNISSVIAAQAKAKGYNIVIAKGIVLYGGDDITSEIIKTVK